MFRKLLLTYYYVWFQGHKRGKNAHTFPEYYHWWAAFLQVSSTFMLIFIGVGFVINEIGILPFFILKNKILVLLVYGLLPSGYVYYMLFNCYKADKENDDEKRVGIIIDKKIRILCWVVYIGLPLGIMVALYFKTYPISM